MAESGCRATRCCVPLGDCAHYHCCADEVVAEIAGQADCPDTSLPQSDLAVETPEPRTLMSELPEDDDSKYWDMSLQEAIHYGLTNSRVLNDLGGTILRNPDAIYSNLTPAIVQSDPRFGIEGALSAFDARLNISSQLQNNDRAYNNLFLSGGNTGRTFEQTLETSRSELVKRSVTGGQFAFRNVTEYDRNTMPSNLFPSAWTTYYEAEARQPLLQGAGVEFNRIAGGAGPLFTQPGYYNGVKIARVNANMSQAEFEIGLRDYLSNLENAYWDLHFAYRDLSSKLELRDSALEIYGLYETRVVKQQKEEPYRLAQIREQYYRFQEDVQNALTGRRVDGTRTNNGTIPGTFRSGSGVYLAERRLRLLLGVPTSDARLIRPIDEASVIELIVDWDQVKAESLARRPELHRQRFRIQKSELELTASRNYLKPQLDMVALYRIRGFGQNLTGYNNDTGSQVPTERFQNAYGNLMTGQFQESQFGLEFSMPIGFRQGHAAVANAEFKLARERAILHEQERQVIHDVGNAVADLTRSYAVAKTAWERRMAAAEYLEGLTNRIRNLDFGSSQLEQWLEAQRRFAEAETQYYLSLADHQVSLKNLSYEKGSMFEYCNIQAVDSMPDQAKSAKTVAEKGSDKKGTSAPQSGSVNLATLDEPASQKPTITQVSATVPWQRNESDDDEER